MGDAGTQTAAFGFGGYISGPTTTTNASEQYNGSGWTTTPTINTARNQLSGAGTQTAALGFGNTTSTESWNGSSWTAVTSLNTARQASAGSGPQSAALVFGGQLVSPPFAALSA